jgi:hypothetical protein
VDLEELGFEEAAADLVLEGVRGGEDEEHTDGELRK